MAGEAEIWYSAFTEDCRRRPFDAAAQRQSAKSGRLGEVSVRNPAVAACCHSGRATEIADRGADLAEQDAEPCRQNAIQAAERLRFGVG